jgi:methionyl-tRNA formyltransferase
MNEIKILLVCSSRFAIPAMRDLVYGQQLAAVVIPANCKEMVEEVRHLLKPLAIPIILVNKNDQESELKKAIKKYAITIGFVMTYSYKIPASVYEMPEKGFLNFHSGPLPEYRGADPIFQQIKNQEKHAGVTVHKLDEGFDTGPVVIKEMLKTETGDTYGIVNNKLAELAAKLCGIIIRMAGFDIALPSKPQDETKANYFKRQSAKDIVIQWQTMDADAIIALINACNPWNKGAITSINNKIIRLLEAEKLPVNNTQETIPGTVLAIENDSITVAVINGETIRINYVCIDEGFLRAGKLTYVGVTPGNCFVAV